MCTQIVIEKEFVVKAMREFKKRYPQTASAHKAALKWASKFVREGCVHDNENGSFTIKPTPGQEYLIVNKVCACGIANPCAHRIAINLAKMALDIRYATSEFLLDRAEAQSELAEPRVRYQTVEPQPQVIAENENDFHVESEEVRAVLREQEERSNE
jgi:hypothetical protein